MSFEEHPSFKIPTEDQIIWRYVDFTKYLSMLTESALFFCRVDKMWGDNFEGTMPLTNFKEDVESWDKHRKNMLSILENIEVKQGATTGISNMINNFRNREKSPSREFIAEQRPYTAISSWHVNDHESAAMWGLYLQTHEGIAVRSSVRRLKQSLSNVSEPVYIGLVNYLDYKVDRLSGENLFEFLLAKRKSFEHERELRALIWRVAEGMTSNSSPWGDVGQNISVDLDVLVEEVVVHPDAPKWFFDLVVNTTKRFGFKYHVVRSGMSSAPLL